MAISNPFEMKLNESNKEGLFFRERSESKEDLFFNKIIESPKKPDTRFLSESRLVKNESKYESTHLEQSNKKYKDILRLFYNHKYCHRVKNF